METYILYINNQKYIFYHATEILDKFSDEELNNISGLIVHYFDKIKVGFIIPALLVKWRKTEAGL